MPRAKAERTRTRDRADILAERRALREQLGSAKNLMTVPQKAGKVRRWVNVVMTETGADYRRLDYFKRMGWTVVTDPVNVGDSDNVTERNKRIEGGATMYVGNNTYSVLMEINQELYDADQVIKAKEVDATDAALDALPNEPGYYGDIHATSQLED